MQIIKKQLVINMIRNIALSICILACIGNTKAVAQGKLKVIDKTENLSPRINYATEQVRLACEELSLKATIKVSIQHAGEEEKLKPEGFSLKSLKKNTVAVVGADESGVL